MKHFCPACEAEEVLVEKKVSIPVGNETFFVKTMVCQKCKRYALTPKNRLDLDKWGRGLTKNIIESQPFFSEAAHIFAEEMARNYGLKKVPFLKALTSYYLNHIVNRDDFQELKKYFESHAARKSLQEGAKSKVNVPIRYLMYKKLQIFCDVWMLPHARAIEEASLFGLAVLSQEENNFNKLQQISQSLREYIVELALAA